MDNLNPDLNPINHPSTGEHYVDFDWHEFVDSLLISHHKSHSLFDWSF